MRFEYVVLVMRAPPLSHDVRVCFVKRDARVVALAAVLLAYTVVVE